MSLITIKKKQKKLTEFQNIKSQQIIHVQSHLSAKRYLKGSLSCFDLSLCHLSSYEIAPDLKAHRLTTQPAAVQQCSYSQPSDSKLLLSFLTTPCALSHLQNEPCWKFHYKLPCVYSIPLGEENPLFSPAPVVSMLIKHTYMHSKLR